MCLTFLQCDGQRPACMPCITSEITCHYGHTGANALRKENKHLKYNIEALNTVLDHVRSVPDHEALSVLGRLRACSNVSEALACLQKPPPPQQPSSHQFARSTLPPTASFVDYELTVLHSLVYPTLEPIELPDIDINDFEDTSAPETPTSVAIEDFATSTSASGHSAFIAPSRLRANPLKPASTLPGPSPPVDNAASRLRWCDPRLNRLDISYWTRVPVSNDFAASAISTYLEVDHALLGFFDADLFLTDLVEQRLSYCSPFLVSSVMCMACVSGTSPSAIHFLANASY